MKNFIGLSQYLLLGCSFIAALKLARDGNIEISLAFVLLSFNFGFNLINQNQLIRETINSIKKEIDFYPVNDKIQSIIDEFSKFKKHLENLEQSLLQEKQTLQTNS